MPKGKVKVPTPEERERMCADMVKHLAARWGTMSPEEKLVAKLDRLMAETNTLYQVEIAEHGVVRDRKELFNAMAEVYQYGLSKFDKQELEKLFASFLTAKQLEHVFS